MTHDPNRKIKTTLAKNHSCYVLITCDGPDNNGEMQVEMTYEGDPALASYLLQGAQNVIKDQELLEVRSSC